MKPKGKKIEYIPLNELKFDPKNPRLPNGENLSEDEIIKFMLRDASIIELMGSIGENGYFIGEPLFVYVNNGSNYVVEGNRRLTALKLLSYPETAPIRNKVVLEASILADNKPTEIPVLIFDDRKELLHFLGYRHVTGIKSWGPLAKARYLKQLKDDDPSLSYKELAQSIGSRANFVQRQLVGLAVYDYIANHDFFDLKNVDQDNIEFSILTTALGFNDISSYLELENNYSENLEGLNHDHLKELTSWIFQKNPTTNKTRLGESRNLKHLSKIVQSQEALKSFKEGATLDEAILLTNEPSKIIHSSIEEAQLNLKRANSYIYLLKASEVDDRTLDTLRQIISLSNQLGVAMKNLKIDIFESDARF